MVEFDPSKADLDAQREVHRLRLRMRDLVTDSDLGNRAIEARAGFSPGYLAQLLSGNLELKLSHVLAVVTAVGESPARFFRRLHPVAAASGTVDLAEDRDLARVCGFGIESLSRLRRRLERFEDALGGLDVEATEDE